MALQNVATAVTPKKTVFKENELVYLFFPPVSFSGKQYLNDAEEHDVYRKNDDHIGRNKMYTICFGPANYQGFHIE